MEKKGPYTISELKALPVGSQFWGKYLVMQVSHRKTKDGREIIDLKIGDASGEIYAIVWDTCPVNGKMEPGTVVGLLGDVGQYNNRLQITAKRIKLLAEEDPLEYVKKPPISIESLIKEFDRILASVKDSCMQELLRRVFTLEIREKFFQAPAAKKIHHNYSGGLLEHSVSVAGLCSQAADSYTDLNRDLLLTGALLHDIGKLAEFEYKVTPSYTTEGRLLGHIIMGNELIAERIQTMKNEGIDFPAELEWMIKHMVISHHGSLEFGSPVIPLFPEAFVLSTMDNLDAKVFVFRNKIEENDGEEEFFTNYDSFFGQNFYTYRYKKAEDC